MGNFFFYTDTVCGVCDKYEVWQSPSRFYVKYNVLEHFMRFWFLRWHSDDLFCICCGREKMFFLFMKVAGFYEHVKQQLTPAQHLNPKLKISIKYIFNHFYFILMFSVMTFWWMHFLHLPLLEKLILIMEIPGFWKSKTPL